MSRLLSILRRVNAAASNVESFASLQRWAALLPPSVKGLRAITTTAPTDTPSNEPVEEDPLAHATGLERTELEYNMRGIDLTKEEWLNAPFGTVEKPVEVPSMYEERIVGVPDPDDDCIITWGSIRLGEPPRQIVEGGEYFVLKKILPPDWAQDV